MKEATIHQHVPDARIFQPSAVGQTLEAQALRRVYQLVPSAYARLITLIWLWTRSTPYGATDGRLLLLNPDGLERMRATSDPVGYCAFLLLHEAFHAMLNHSIRLMAFEDRLLANIAADYVINAMIMEINDEAVRDGKWKASTQPFPLISGGLLDPQLSDNKAVETLYRELKALKDAEPPAPEPQTGAGNPDDDCNGGDGGEEDDSDDGPRAKGKGKSSDDDDMGAADGGDWDTDDDDSDDDDSDDDSDSGTGTGTGKGKGKPQDADGHDMEDGSTSQWGDFGDDEGKSANGDAAGGEGGEGKGKSKRPTLLGDRIPRVPATSATEQDDADKLPDFNGTGEDGHMDPILDEDTAETLSQMGERIDREIERMAIEQDINNRAGVGIEGSSGIAAIMKQKLRKAPGDWHESVRNWMSDRCNKAWKKPMNVPIYKGTGLIAVGQAGKQMGEIVIAIDVSYSVPEKKVREMLSEIQVTLDTLNPKMIHLLECPDHVRKTWELRAGDIVPEDLNYGGGTAFRPTFDWIERNVIACEGLIYMTDGDAYDTHSLSMPEYPVLWLNWAKRTSQYVSWGEIVTIID